MDFRLSGATGMYHRFGSERHATMAGGSVGAGRWRAALSGISNGTRMRFCLVVEGLR